MKGQSRILTLTVAYFLFIFSLYPLSAQQIDEEIFAQRREVLLKEMDGGICIYQNSERNKNFYYLTGFMESRSAFVLLPGEEKKFIMFVQPYNPAYKSRTGVLSGLEGVKTHYGADDAFPFDEFEKKLRVYLRDKRKIYCDFNNKELYEKLLQMTRYSQGTWMKTMIDPTNFIHEMRVIKSPEEIEIMQKAIDITSAAHIEVMRAAEPGMYEYELQAIIEYIYRKNGSLRNGFPCIVGSGPNSVVLHYEENTRKTQSGDMVVMDIGAEYGEYSADITRTIPINGKFTEHQADIYQAVLDANKTAIEKVAAGVGYQEVMNAGIEKIKENLFNLGLITDRESRWQYRVWLTHGIGHWLGLVVHDVGDYRRMEAQGRTLEPGMVFTIEPGIYIQEDILDHLKEMRSIRASDEEIDAFVEKVRRVAARYANIGVRIEDDVWVTPDGYKVLSEKAPKEIRDVEEMMAKKSYLNQ